MCEKCCNKIIIIISLAFALLALGVLALLASSTNTAINNNNAKITSVCNGLSSAGNVDFISASEVTALVTSISTQTWPPPPFGTQEALVINAWVNDAAEGVNGVRIATSGLACSP